MADKVQIQAIALGSDADKEFLLELVDLTDGRFYHSTATNIQLTFAQIIFEG